ncbi:MAG: DUF3047 domain-containing protein [Candidatus Omnitrophota bacterium]
MKQILPKRFWIYAIIIISIIFTALFFGPPLKKRGAAPVSKYKVGLLAQFPFSENDSLKDWEEKVFKGRVAYNIEKSGDLSYVRGTSDKSASALYYRINIDAKNKHPVISWKWRARIFPAKKFEESLDGENEDDFAARFYVIFPAMFITNYKVLEYVWAESLPAGAVGTSPYSENIKLMVLKSGIDEENVWFTEERDIVSDYIKMFGRPPEAGIGAIAFMTNAEHTQTSAEALYDEITVGYKEEPNKAGRRRP